MLLIWSTVRNLALGGLMALNVYFWANSGNPKNAAVPVFVGFVGLTLVIQDAAREGAR